MSQNVRQITLYTSDRSVIRSSHDGVLTLELMRYSEGVRKPWSSRLESSRHMQWYDPWRRVDKVGRSLPAGPQALLDFTLPAYPGY